MVITAVHLDAEGRPIRYKVENSWGKEVGDKGWFVMTADWFREHVFSVVVQRGQAEKMWIDILDEGETVMLDPWDVLSMRS
jgi:bleomycin hydrolase